MINHLVFSFTSSKKSYNVCKRLIKSIEKIVHHVVNLVLQINVCQEVCGLHEV